MLARKIYKLEESLSSGCGTRGFTDANGREYGCFDHPSGLLSREPGFSISMLVLFGVWCARRALRASVAVPPPEIERMALSYSRLFVWGVCGAIWMLLADKLGLSRHFSKQGDRLYLTVVALKI